MLNNVTLVEQHIYLPSNTSKIVHIFSIRTRQLNGETFGIAIIKSVRLFFVFLLIVVSQSLVTNCPLYHVAVHPLKSSKQWKKVNEKRELMFVASKTSKIIISFYTVQQLVIVIFLLVLLRVPFIIIHHYVSTPLGFIIFWFDFMSDCFQFFHCASDCFEWNDAKMLSDKDEGLNNK